ncbi:MAG TPA: zinc-binding dehydrogenase [Pseudomonadales bacterium]|jgi:threonine dehydrogenase-like Zn-dependent dehydrogenase|nr:zinc-binding dehydrogenase [Pseudomonadales bacterium]MDP6314642.1 zinc-binding dehydrogenase [Pseudomonadales bacterium]MDP7313377.1 zinc-binding dehydrogenase [Pseudomonadales bacterium]HJP49831.1 zinc-binding dehydrogenase [Pseudomonadales bacterium]|tara:strand:+ start:618 stop:1715 length:1098 start_codon:yes stop_codon:yes gene_type:complete
MNLPKKSFSMVLTANQTLQPMDITLPDIDDESALLRIETCGICGSDYEQFEGQLRTPLPVIPGHEPLGVVAKIGDKAALRWGVDVGDRVAVETMLACKHCQPCLTGNYHLCDQRRIYSYIPLSEKPGLWGAYSQYMFLHANSIVHPVDSNLPPEIAVMFNPLGAGFRWAVEMPGAQPGDTVVVLGPGQRGLASVIALRSVGVKSIIVTGLAADSEKLKLARFYGATHTVDVENEDVVERVSEITQGMGADIVVDVSSYATKPVADALKLVKMGGRIVLAGVKGFKSVDQFVSDLIVMKEITIQGAIGVTSSGYKKAIELLEFSEIEFSRMHTHDFALSDAELAIRTLAREIEGSESIHSCLIPPD